MDYKQYEVKWWLKRLKKRNRKHCEVCSCTVILKWHGFTKEGHCRNYSAQLLIWEHWRPSRKLKKGLKCSSGWKSRRNSSTFIFKGTSQTSSICLLLTGPSALRLQDLFCSVKMAFSVAVRCVRGLSRNINLPGRIGRYLKIIIDYVLTLGNF